MRGVPFVKDLVEVNGVCVHAAVILAGLHVDLFAING